MIHETKIVIPGGGMWPAMDAEVRYRYVASSNVEWVGWDAAGNLYLKFKSGGTYAYVGVGRQKAVAMAHSPSVGRYFHRKIKGKYAPLQLA